MALVVIFGRKFGDSLVLLRSSNLCGGLLTIVWPSNKTLADEEFDSTLDARYVSVLMKMVDIVL
jgi:hypothetical protein